MGENEKANGKMKKLRGKMERLTLTLKTPLYFLFRIFGRFV
jgi:hypothetical protein